jgi:hypothetical protein
MWKNIQNDERHDNTKTAWNQYATLATRNNQLENGDANWRSVDANPLNK